jgi:hypothetical protein
MTEDARQTVDFAKKRGARKLDRAEARRPELAGRLDMANRGREREASARSAVEEKTGRCQRVLKASEKKVAEL